MGKCVEKQVTRRATWLKSGNSQRVAASLESEQAVILGLGVDLVDNGRLEQELAGGDWRVHDSVFVENEIRQYRDLRKSSQWYAACFAAKEAALKALNISVFDFSVFRDVELEERHTGCYELSFHGQLEARCRELGVKNATVRIAHGKKVTIASVLLND